MAKKSLHWMDRIPDPNVQGSSLNHEHRHPIRMPANSILKLLTLKAKLLGKRLDVQAEAARFEERQS